MVPGWPLSFVFEGPNTKLLFGSKKRENRRAMAAVNISLVIDWRNRASRIEMVVHKRRCISIERYFPCLGGRGMGMLEHYFPSLVLGMTSCATKFQFLYTSIEQTKHKFCHRNYTFLVDEKNIGTAQTHLLRIQASPS